MMWSILLAVLSMIESGGNTKAIGDNGDAHGILQVHQEVVRDVNSLCKAEVLQKWGRLLTHKDMFNREKAMWTCQKYLEYWGKAYEKQTGKAPTMDVLARIWNGGPQGYKSKHTLGYMKKFKAELARQQKNTKEVS
jgi:hypothetical protein